MVSDHGHPASHVQIDWRAPHPVCVTVELTKTVAKMPERGMPVESRSSRSRRGVVMAQSMYLAYQIWRV